MTYFDRLSLTIGSTIIMRPSSVGGGRILRRTLSVCPSVPFAEVVLLFFTLQPSYERTSKITTSVFDYRPASTLRTCGIFCFVYALQMLVLLLLLFQGRIPYGDISRTSLFNHPLI